MTYLSTKFEGSSFSHSRYMNEDPLCENRVIWGDWGHSRSPTMSPIDTMDMICYSPFTETMHLSYISLEIQRAIC